MTHVMCIHLDVFHKFVFFVLYVDVHILLDVA